MQFRFWSYEVISFRNNKCQRLYLKNGIFLLKRVTLVLSVSIDFSLSHIFVLIVAQHVSSQNFECTSRHSRGFDSTHLQIMIRIDRIKLGGKPLETLVQTANPSLFFRSNNWFCGLCLSFCWWIEMSSIIFLFCSVLFCSIDLEWRNLTVIN